MLFLAHINWRIAHCDSRKIRTKKFDEIEFIENEQLFNIRTKNARAQVLMKLTPVLELFGFL
jgi:hypothetical protein